MILECEAHTIDDVDSIVPTILPDGRLNEVKRYMMNMSLVEISSLSEPKTYPGLPGFDSR